MKPRFPMASPGAALLAPSDVREERADINQAHLPAPESDQEASHRRTKMVAGTWDCEVVEVSAREPSHRATRGAAGETNEGRLHTPIMGSAVTDRGQTGGGVCGRGGGAPHTWR